MQRCRLCENESEKGDFHLREMDPIATRQFY